ncbi:MAG: 2,3-bisphosphoglycerate-independent phosphoglycerate mutase [Acidobacteriaceae bacterium]
MEFKTYEKLALVVLDGFGIATPSRGNAITLANPSTINKLIEDFPATTLQASGPSVGLPWGEMGNSEVGHLNLGAGRIIGQDLSRITLAIEDRTFFKNPAFLEAIEHVKKNNSKLHLVGMISPGGVHSYDEHAYALIGLAAENGISNVLIHMFLDGRDTPPQIALDSLDKLKRRIQQMNNIGKVATVSGRFYAMDRAEHWNLTEQTYRAMVFGEGPKAKSAEEAIQTNYDSNVFDEMIPPTVILDENGKPQTVTDGDAMIFFNFRPDRALQLVRAFAQMGFSKFAKPTENFLDLKVVGMTEYTVEFSIPTAFPPNEVSNGFAELISKQGLRQFHIAESEKYAHVSVFFNGGTINPYPGEEREIITSPASNYQNYEDVPEMSAFKLTESFVNKFKSGYSFFLANFANSDMVGHTGSIKASVLAIQAIDSCVEKIVKACLEQNICLIITADHGNSEELINVNSGGIDKEHSTNPVPFILVAEQFRRKKPRDSGLESLAGVMPIGVLSDVAPTLLELMGFEKPKEMTGISLLPQLFEQLR